MERQNQNSKFILKHFPEVLLGYAQESYSGTEYYQKAKSFIKPYLNLFEKLSEENLSNVFACLIRSIVSNREGLDNTWTSEMFRERGKKMKEFHGKIISFEKAVLSLIWHEYENKEQGIFPIKRIIFEGKKNSDKNVKTNKIILEGTIIDLIRELFKAFYDIGNLGINAKQELGLLAPDLVSVYDKFESELSIQNAGENTLAKRYIRIQEETNKETAFNKYRNNMAFHIHRFLKKYCIENENVNIPEWHKRFIGDFFNLTGTYDEEFYSDIPSTYDKVSHWINDGRN